MKWIFSILKAVGPFLATLLGWIIKGALRSEERARQAKLEREELIKSEALQSEREKQHVKVIEEINSDDLSPERVGELLSIGTAQSDPAYFPKGKES